jgi:hypothetical protein
MCLATETPVESPLASTSHTCLLQQMQSNPKKQDLSSPMVFSLSKRSCRDTVAEQALRKKRKLQKSVRIMECENELYYRPYDNDDLKGAWMQQSDFDDVKEGNRQTLKAVIKSCNELSELDPDEYCLRGLERHIETIFFKSTRGKGKSIVQRVLSDQVLKRDEESISEVYAVLSRSSTLRALDRACVDALR